MVGTWYCVIFWGRDSYRDLICNFYKLGHSSLEIRYSLYIIRNHRPPPRHIHLLLQIEEYVLMQSGWFYSYPLHQWFSTGVPRHTGVPYDNARGATNNRNSLILYLFFYQGVLPNIDIANQGCRVEKRLRNTALHTHKHLWLHFLLIEVMKKCHMEF